MMHKKGNTTAYREALRVKILELASPFFKKNGISAVKMDDIANELGISKRTIYELYSNKEDLLFECVKHDSLKAQKLMTDYAAVAENEMDLLAYGLKMKLEDIEQINPCFLESIHKYPKIVDFINHTKIEQSLESNKLIKRCVDKGFFMEDINYDILYKLTDAMVACVMQSRLYQQFSLKEIFLTIITVHIRGCCTKVGIDYLNKYVEKFKAPQ